MRTEEEIRKKMDELEDECAYASYQYNDDVADSLYYEIKRLRWVLEIPEPVLCTTPFNAVVVKDKGDK